MPWVGRPYRARKEQGPSRSKAAPCSGPWDHGAELMDVAGQRALGPWAELMATVGHRTLGPWTELMAVVGWGTLGLWAELTAGVGWGSPGLVELHILGQVHVQDDEVVHVASGEGLAHLTAPRLAGPLPHADQGIVGDVGGRLDVLHDVLQGHVSLRPGKFSAQRRETDIPRSACRLGRPGHCFPLNVPGGLVCPEPITATRHFKFIITDRHSNPVT